MRYLLPIILMLTISSCSYGEKKATPLTSQPKAYSICFMGDRINFRGIYLPSIVDERPGDKVETRERRGICYINVSQHERCLAETKKAREELRVIVVDADTTVLLKSFRDLPEENNLMDDYICQDGNEIVYAELIKRKPLPPELINECPAGFFTGRNGPRMDVKHSLFQSNEYRTELRAEIP